MGAGRCPLTAISQLSKWALTTRHARREYRADDAGAAVHVGLAPPGGDVHLARDEHHLDGDEHEVPVRGANHPIDAGQVAGDLRERAADVLGGDEAVPLLDFVRDPGEESAIWNATRSGSACTTHTTNRTAT